MYISTEHSTGGLKGQSKLSTGARMRGAEATWISSWSPVYSQYLSAHSTLVQMPEGVRVRRVVFVQNNALYSTVQYSAVQYSAVQCSIVQYIAVQCSTVQYSTVQCSTVQYSAVQCSTVQYSAVQLQYSAVQCQYSAVQHIWVSFQSPVIVPVLCHIINNFRSLLWPNLFPERLRVVQYKITSTSTCQKMYDSSIRSE